MTTFTRTQGAVGDSIEFELDGIDNLDHADTVSASIWSLDASPVTLTGEVVDSATRRVRINLGTWLQSTAVPGTYSYRTNVLFDDASDLPWPEAGADRLIVFAPTQVCDPWQSSCLPWDVVLCNPIEDADLSDRAIAAATDALYVRTGSRFRLCVDSVFPCFEPCNCWTMGLDWRGCARCGFRRLDLSNLIEGPITQILSVTNGSDVVDPSQYWLDRGRYLVPLRDGDLWPWPDQDRNLAPGTVGTWYVQVEHGRPAPSLLQIAAGDLANQLATFCAGGECELPSNAIEVTREGITVRLDTGLNAIGSVRIALEAYGSASERVHRSRITDPSTWVTL